VRALIFPAHETFFTPHAVGRDDFFIFVGEQRERQLELFHELVMRLDRVGADAEDDRAFFLEVGKVIAEGAGFLGAAGRVVLRIKIEDDVLSVLIGEGNFPAAARRSGKFRGGVADLQLEFNCFGHKIVPE